VSDVASLHLIRGRCYTHACVAGASLLLYDGYESVTCGREDVLVAFQDSDSAIGRVRRCFLSI
jgi:hypothetical protein